MLSQKYADCLSYIDSYWDTIIVHKHQRNSYFKRLILQRVKEKMRKHVLDVPHGFLVPNDKKFDYVFYWDTFFMFRGLIKTKREWILKDMVDNFVYLFDKYGIIPNFNAPAATGRSQPPFFTSMILDTYNGYYFGYLKKNTIQKIFTNMYKYKNWLKNATEAAKKEYWQVWMDPDQHYHHTVSGFALNRYGDRDIGYAHSSELESGWDFTSRFYNRCDQFLPIDLNVYLFKYERDFAKIAFHLNNSTEETFWQERATRRRQEINRLMWNKKEGFFYDYGYVYKRKSEFLSLAGFTPLWSGLATPDQARQMVKKLPLFETAHGLVITTKDSLAPKINLSKIPSRYRLAIDDVLSAKQWDYPHIWPPLEYLTVVGLLKYGFVADATRIMKKSVKTQAAIFRKYKTFFEKIDGVTGNKPKDFHYASQSGFGWTNAAFYRYIQLLEAIESGVNIYSQPQSATPPYRLSIPH